ncbi:hypothetical protein DPMN_180175 [Dreissena polymorpha]|uniref:Uncharacterized protein n=1 Tax=Dreissena polymorpha TaxID=45954 RepID=A0A9D4EFT4_DREPO|nr:hypothetical protein DPMN_180175 [Dreissena polymorpha]
MKESNGVEKIYNEIVDSRFKDVRVAYSEKNRMAFRTASILYLETLIQNIKDRFEEESMDKLQQS